MRVVIAVVILAVSIPLNGCCRPQQAAYAKPNRSSWENPQARPKRPDLIKASSVRPPQPISKPRQPTKASLVKPPQPVRTVPESTKASSVKPPQPVHTVPESTKASSAEPSAPLPQRKPEQPPTNASVPSREGSDTVEKEAEAKFKAAEAKAKREGVDSLTREDIQGLSPEQLKQLRGY
jgi:hypothetical protein